MVYLTLVEMLVSQKNINYSHLADTYVQVILFWVIPTIVVSFPG